jgi:MoxR-like ATPase
MTTSVDHAWHLYRGDGRPHDGIRSLPEAPPWRRFHSGPVGAEPDDDTPVAGSTTLGERPGVLQRAAAYRPDQDVADAVNAAMFLRRPLLVTGKPGTGKSMLAYSIAFELGLGPVLHWPVTSRSTLTDALYRYDAIGRLQETNLTVLNREMRDREMRDREMRDREMRDREMRDREMRDRDENRVGAPDEDGVAAPDIGKYLRLGPLGTALLPWPVPRVLLIDELDKSDIDLPNDLLNVFEEGQYEIVELRRLPAEQQPVTVATDDGGTARIDGGTVGCREFPIVIITSNGEREFPSAFRRRCLSLDIDPPGEEKLRAIVAAQLGAQVLADNDDLLREFLSIREVSDLATDQLLSLMFLASAGSRPSPDVRERLIKLVYRPIGQS